MAHRMRNPRFPSVHPEYACPLAARGSARPLLAALVVLAFALLHGYLIEPQWLRFLPISHLHLHAKPAFVNGQIRRS